MIDITLIRDKQEWVAEQLHILGEENVPLAEIVILDQQRRQILQEVEELRREKNVRSKENGQQIGNFKRLEKQLAQAEAAGEPINDLRVAVETARLESEAATAVSRELGDRISHLSEQLRQVETDLNAKLLWVPNMPHPSVPHGQTDADNIAGPAQGAPLPSFDFTPRPHWELGVEAGLIDFERGIKLSGSRFYILKGWGARLQRAVIQFMLDLHTQKHGYTEIYPPFMVRSAMFEAAAQLPKFAENIYRDAEEDFMFLGTAEIALTNLHRDEIIDEADLPLNYVAYTPCFRREKMSAGRDVRGIKRGHQFDKVEMYKFAAPESSYAELENIMQDAIDVCRQLELPYRIIEICAADLGFAAAKKYDIEVWAAGCKEWLEVSSASNVEAFQARRANIRLRRTEGGKVEPLHTLNASGLALPRVMIALLENNQQEDGSILIPAALQPYLGGATVIPASA